MLRVILPFFLMELMDSMQTGHWILGREGLEGGTVGLEGGTVELVGMEEVWEEGAKTEVMGDKVRSMVVSTRALGWGVTGKLASALLLFCISMNAAPIGDTGWACPGAPSCSWLISSSDKSMTSGTLSSSEAPTLW